MVCAHPVWTSVEPMPGLPFKASENQPYLVNLTKKV